MEPIQKLMLRVEGGAWDDVMSTLVTIGSPSEELRLERPASAHDEPVWSIVHHAVYTAYSMWQPARTAQGEKGQLQVSLFVPPSQQMTSESTPLDMLNRVLEQLGYVTGVMPQLPGGAQREL